MSLINLREPIGHAFTAMFNTLQNIFVVPFFRFLSFFFCIFLKKRFHVEVNVNRY